jgi:hypothetical protein
VILLAMLAITVVFVAAMGWVLRRRGNKSQSFDGRSVEYRGNLMDDGSGVSGIIYGTDEGKR